MNKKQEESGRSQFSGKIGFILAAAGSAVGLGNLWRFPYLAARHGGGIFLLVYVLLTVTFGFTLMIIEIAMGRKTGLSTVGAFSYFNKKYAAAGWLTMLVPVLVLPYYCVIGGWVIKYFMTYLTGAVKQAAETSYYNTFIADGRQVALWTLLFLALTTIVVIGGVKKGIEKISTILMPILVALSVVIAVYCITLPGAWEGVLYYIKPDFSRFSLGTVLAALGQLFLSMSLATGIMITYGSYLDKDTDIEFATKQIELFDTGIAFLSGLMIIPAVFSFSGGDESVLGSGPGLMFITLPKVFGDLSFGVVVGTVFFLLVFFAAWTSAVSMMEAIVSVIIDEFHLKRRTAGVLTGIYLFAASVPSALGYGILSWFRPLGMTILDFMDYISNSILMPIVALVTCLFAGYGIKTKWLSEEIKISSSFKRENMFLVMTKYIAPILIVIILFGAFF